MALNTSLPVLIVDDYQTMLRIIRNLLKQIGFNDVDEAKDGSEALGKLKEKKDGLVISDWNMAPMTGFELLQKVRADAELASLPFTMINAEAKTENVVAAERVTQMAQIWGGLESFNDVEAFKMPEREGDEALLNGPAPDGDPTRTSQDAIDALFG